MGRGGAGRGPRLARCYRPDRAGPPPPPPPPAALEPRSERVRPEWGGVKWPLPTTARPRHQPALSGGRPRPTPATRGPPAPGRTHSPAALLWGLSTAVSPLETYSLRNRGEDGSGPEMASKDRVDRETATCRDGPSVLTGSGALIYFTYIAL